MRFACLLSPRMRSCLERDKRILIPAKLRQACLAAGTALSLLLCSAPAQSLESTARSGQPMAGAELGTGNVIQLILALFAVLATIMASAWLLRRFGRIQATSSQFRILGGISIGTREKVVLLQVGKTQMLLGVSPGRVERIHVLDEPLVEAQEDSAPSSSFSSRLSAALKGNQS